MIKVSDLLNPPLPAPAGGSMIPSAPNQGTPARPQAPPMKPMTPSVPRPAAPTGSSATSNVTPALPAPAPRPQVPIPPPAQAPTPPTVKPTAPPQAAGWTGPQSFSFGLTPEAAKPFTDLLPSPQRMEYLKDTVGTEAKPPLSYLTSHLGEAQGPADSALSWIQKGLTGPQGPQTFASFAGGLGKPIVEPLLNTPFGLPLLAGGYGLLRGGESFAAAKHLLGPLLERMGINGET